MRIASHRFLSGIAGLAVMLGAGSAAASPAGRHVRRDFAWFQTGEGKEVAERVLSWQAPDGGWPKNGDTTAEIFAGDVATLKGTYDNGATRDEIRLLGRAYAATGDARFREAALRGIDGILAAQGALGGWPQSYSPGERYARHITLNDGVMVGLLGLLREVAEAKADFGWVDAGRRDAAARAIGRGVECLLECQVVVEGRRTVWCAQHDERNRRPRPARAFEPVSLSGAESADVLVFLMGLDDPDARLVGAIEDGAAWFEAARIRGLREERRDGDKVMVEDAGAPELWARFYEIGSNRPLFAGRDGVRRYRLDEIAYERRTGYSWYGRGGEKVARAFEEWKSRWPGRPAPAPPVVRDPLAPPLVVAADGSGDFRTVGEAVEAAPTGSVAPVVVFIEPGQYRERIVVTEGKPNLSLVGRDAGRTRIVWGRGEPITSAVGATVTVAGDGFSAAGIGFFNDFGPGVPAPALRVLGDRAVFRDCRVDGWDRTLMGERGRHYFEACVVGGHLAFVAGAATAWFEDCELHCRATGAIALPDTAGRRWFSRVRITGARGVVVPERMREAVDASGRPLRAEDVLGGDDGWKPVEGPRP